MDPVFLLLVALGAAIWYWLDGLGARERAVAEARATCRALGLQFLDDTVALRRIRLARNHKGHLRPLRTFGFEFSESGQDRRPGQVEVLGAEVINVYTGPRLVAEMTPLH